MHNSGTAQTSFNQELKFKLMLLTGMLFFLNAFSQKGNVVKNSWWIPQKYLLFYSH
jgi:hypothetical protein